MRLGPAGPVQVWLVPLDAAYIAFRSGDRHLWQVPIDGVVALPFDETATVTALDSNGVALPNDSAVADEVDDWQPPWLAPEALDNLDAAQNDQVRSQAIDALDLCLGNMTGAASDGTTTTMTDEQVWSLCLYEANIVAAREFESLGGVLVGEPGDDPGLMTTTPTPS